MTVAATPETRPLAEQVAFACLLGVVASVVFSIAGAEILLTVVVVAWLVLLVGRRERLEWPAVFWPLGAYAAWTLVSVAFSADWRASLADSKELVLFLMVPLVYRLARGRRAWTVLEVLITVGAVSAVVGVVQYGVLNYDHLGRRPQGTLGHYMTYSGTLMLVVVATAARLLFRRDQRTWPALVLPALGVALALTFTRSAWVGASVGLALLLLLKDFRLVAAIPVLVALGVALAPHQVTARMYSMFNLNDPTNRDRLAMIREGVRMVRDHPLTGVGPDMVIRRYAEYRDPAAVEPVNPHLHNVPLQIAAERGLPALGIWVWFVVWLARDLWRAFRTGRDAALGAAGLAALASMLAAGLFEYNFGDSEFLILWLVLVTLPLAAARAPGPAAPPVRP
jgi:putative inorganic carbon (HCO3(-)) transporter